MTETMRAAVMENYSGIENLRIAALPVPQPQAGQLLVRVHAAGLNPANMAVASGLMQLMFPLTFPAIAGGELAGVVAAIPEGETLWHVGDEVHALIGITGAFADYALVPSQAAVRKPQGMSFAAAAALPTAVATATAALDRGEIGPGTRVVVHAAAGGVGSILVQLAKARGAHVTALASGVNLAFVTGLGADVVVDRSGDAVSTIRDADVVIDGFGPAAQEISWEMLKRGGHLVSLVTQPDPDRAATYGVTASKIFGNTDPAHLVAANALYEAGRLTSHVMAEYPLQEVVPAFRRLAARQSRGKIVLTIASE